MNKNIICWFEIYVKDMNRAKQFYNAVLGIQFSDVCDAPGEAAGDMQMSFFSSNENQGVSGALVYMPGTKEGDGKAVNTMVYFPCQDCSVEAAKIEPAGGKVLHAKMSIGEFGFCTIAEDSEGNAFGLFSMS